MFERVKEMIAENLGVDPDGITEVSNFREDLNADSLDLFELVMAVEDEYGISIPAEDLQTINTVGEMLDYIRAHQ